MPLRTPFVREFELCCESLQACEAAAAGGADRVELCTGLDVGGVTPPLSLLRAAQGLSLLPVHVLVRPRAGGFHYSAREFSLLIAQMEEFLSEGAAGIVTGTLDAEGCIDLTRMQEVMRVAGTAPVTFHRAFDLTQDLSVSLEQIIDLGCVRVLTSGGAVEVVSGLSALRRLAAQAAGRIRIAAGGGVRLANAASLLEVPGLDLHASLRTFNAAEAAHPLERAFGANYTVRMRDVRAITELVHSAHAG